MSSSRGKKAAVPSSKRRRGPGSSSVVMTNNDDPGTIHFRLGGLALAPLSSTYDPSCSKASALPFSLQYLYAILAHTLTGRRESISVVNTHDAYYLWCMTERHRKGVISIGPYVTHISRHFSILNIAAQSSVLTLIGQMSPQGITIMLHMRMIERQRGIDPPQYRLSHAIDEKDLEDIPDDVPS
ncbi:hypothetical protein GOBAR_AA25742 [Gossypium barbadense]|uniref:Uncharacterized protein n=1 Tax=Gossypium barbadense TaxID=3634 RepID=A0A2P5WV16_GOSBA|nr:hypothetical protein GOBAR_AA25742 [Gossypium barbadense]